eukprot:scaffold8332_cov305-Pinguiococcus_pyrenoidosus.AAC.1
MNDGLLFQAVEDGNVELLRSIAADAAAVKLGGFTDLGTSAAYLAVLNDQPEVLRALHEMQVDLGHFCDPESFGTPLFYAVFYASKICVETLFSLGVDLESPCDTFGSKPRDVAMAQQHELIAQLID